MKETVVKHDYITRCKNSVCISKCPLW